MIADGAGDIVAEEGMAGRVQLVSEKIVAVDSQSFDAD